MKKQMKKFIGRSAFLALLLVGFISCNDLPVDTQGELAAEGFYSSIEDINTGTLGVYSVLADRLFANSENYCHFWAADDRTAAAGSNKTFYLQFDQMVPLDTNPWQTNGWNQLWEIIGAANTFLDNEAQMRGVVAGGQEELLNRSLGEVHYLRAFVYFELVRTWGTIPLITSQAEITGQEPLASFEDIYALIIEDLIYAKANLEPESVGGVYRANRWRAQALLAHVYLTSAGFPLKKTANYALAAAEAKNVIDNGPYELELGVGGFETTYEKRLWVDGNKECIIVLPADQELDGWGSGNYQGLAAGAFADKVVEKAFYANFPAGARKDFSFETNNSNLTYSSQKFGNLGDFGGNSLDINIMRYSELLLIFAEAQIRATGNESDADAIAALNEVKDRAGVPLVSSATWQDIVWEKAWETAGEWSRWYDIIRTETLDEVNALRSPLDGPLLGTIINEAFPWSPIPVNDVTANPNLQK
jgi:hypothetical protein